MNLGSKVLGRFPSKLGDHFYRTKDVPVEFFELFDGYPVFLMNGAADGMDLIAIQKSLLTLNRVTYPALGWLYLAFQSLAICVAYSSFNTG